MTRDEIEKMTARELEREIATLRGYPWRRPTHGTCCTCQTCGAGHDECKCGITEDILAAWELEGEIPFNGWERYTRWLGYCVSKSDSTLWVGDTAYYSGCPEDKIPKTKLSPHTFCLIHATAEQRCRAWLLWKQEG